MNSEKNDQNIMSVSYYQQWFIFFANEIISNYLFDFAVTIF